MYPYNDRIRLVWITPKFPLGAPDGARHATSVLIRHLADLGVKIELICVLPESEPADASAAQKYLGVSSCCRVPRSGWSGSLFTAWNTPYTFRTFVAPATRKRLHNELTRVLAADQRRHTFVLLDGLHLFAALGPQDFQILPKRCDGVIYRAHNFETTLWEQCIQQARTPWSRWLFKHQTALVKEFERRITQTVPLTVPVSDDDTAKFKALAPDASVTTVPIGIDFPDESAVEPVSSNGTLFEILFVGRLDWMPNKRGLKWFIQNVWPRLFATRPEARLKIAGVGNGRWLNPYKKMPGVHFLGRVTHLEGLYRTCALTIAPLFQGSGTRVKILEAARHARPVLSTALGAEGSGLVPGLSYYQAETDDQWIHALNALTPEDCRAVGWRAFRDIRDRFDGRTIAENFLEVLQARVVPTPGRTGFQPQSEDFYARTG